MNKKILLSYSLLVIVLFITMVAADNSKTAIEKGAGISKYGKLEIKDKNNVKLVELELKNNTEICAYNRCTSETTITLEQSGKLIDDIRFMTNRKGVQTFENIIDYRLYIKSADRWLPYNYAIVPAGIYQLRLVGIIDPTVTNVDWQFNSKQIWIDDWAVWTPSLNNGLVAYWNMTNVTATKILDMKGGFDGTMVGTLNVTNGKLNKALTPLKWFNTTDAYINITPTNSTLTGLNSTFSAIAWILLNGTAPTNPPIFTTGTGGFSLSISTNNVSLIKEGTSIDIIDNGTLNDGKFHLVGVVVYQNRTGEIWRDGVKTKVGTATSYIGGADNGIGAIGLAGLATNWTGIIDEVGVWNRTLNDTEIIQLWNSGVGINFLNTFQNVTVGLLSPSNNSQTVNNNLNFNATMTPDFLNLTNATISLWFSNGTLVNQTTNLITGSSTNTTLFNIGNLVIASYKWNVFGCAINSTNTICNFADTNFTFTVLGTTENSITYNGNTTEGTTESFRLNLSLGSGVSLNSAVFVWNNTNYSTSISSISNNRSILASIVIPIQTVNSNVNFYWIYNTNINQSNSTVNVQTINNIALDDCTLNNVTILNMTMRDEDSQVILNATGQNTTIDIDLFLSSIGTTNQIIHFSNNYTQINPARVCISNLNSSSYRLDAQIRYSSTNHAIEFFNIQNFTLTTATVPQNITLFDLLTSEAQEFQITFKDLNFLPVEDALISINRKYISEGVFKTVEAPVTDTQGKTIGHFVLSDQIYSITVSKNGAILAVFDNYIATCTNVVTGDCSISLRQISSGINLPDFTNVAGVYENMTFDVPTKTVNVVFFSTQGNKNISLNVIRNDNFGNTTVCSNSVVSTSGSLFCTIPDFYGNVSIIATLSVNGVPVDVGYFSIRPTPTQVWGPMAGLLVIMLFITISLFFISSPVMVIFGGIFALIIAGLMFMLQGSFVGKTSAIILLIVSGGIIVWKISDRNRGFA